MAPFDPVTDAALWAVTCRAHETRRADRALDDPFAAHLVSDRGDERHSAAPDGLESFVLAVQTATVDEVLRHAIGAYRIHTVADLGAGLDTRPYRLELPSDLRWVEADLAPLLDYKTLRLAHAMPCCQVRHVRVDLSDRGGRGVALQEIAKDVTRGLVVTEGIAWMRRREALDDLIERMPPVFHYWVIDMSAPPDPPVWSQHVIDAFERCHWRPMEFHSLRDQALRLGGDRAAALSGGRLRDEHEGVWLFHRAV